MAALNEEMDSCHGEREAGAQFAVVCENVSVEDQGLQFGRNAGVVLDISPQIIHGCIVAQLEGTADLAIANNVNYHCEVVNKEQTDIGRVTAPFICTRRAY